MITNLYGFISSQHNHIYLVPWYFVVLLGFHYSNIGNTEFRRFKLKFVEMFFNCRSPIFQASDKDNEKIKPK